MKHKVGDTVRIKSKAWIDAQPKNCGGAICLPGILMTNDMQKFAGQKATISQTINNGTRYNIYLDGGMWSWVDEMFEDDSDIETLQRRIKQLEAEVLQLKDEKPKPEKIVYDKDKHYVAVWGQDVYLLRCTGDGTLFFAFCGIDYTQSRLTTTTQSGQEAIDAVVAMGDDTDTEDIPPEICIFYTGKEALEFMLKYL